jgi:hypothetical protein
MAVASATFDTSTGMLAFLDASGNNIGNMHFAGNATGLVLDRTSSPSMIAIHDTGANAAPQGPGTIPLTFQSGEIGQWRLPVHQWLG